MDIHPSEHHTMQFTIILQYPDFLADQYGEDQYWAHVEAGTSNEAVAIACREAAEKNNQGEDGDPSDWFVIACLPGHLNDIERTDDPVTPPKIDVVCDFSGGAILGVFADSDTPIRLTIIDSDTESWSGEFIDIEEGDAVKTWGFSVCDAQPEPDLLPAVLKAIDTFERSL